MQQTISKQLHVRLHQSCCAKSPCGLHLLWILSALLWRAAAGVLYSYLYIVYVPTALPACLGRSRETWLAGAAEQQARSHDGAAHAAVHSWGLLQARWGLDCQGLRLCPPGS